MGPVNKRAIPVRQNSRARQIPVPTIATSKSASPPKIQVAEPVNAADDNPDTAQSVRLGASSSVKDSANSASCDLSSRIGSKVCLGGTKTGTFLFCGKTNFSDGIWCGVSLDEPNGKNDGSVNGIRYFTCLPAHGVFIRPIKLEFLQSIDTGKDASHRTLPNVSIGEVVQARKLPVPSALRKLGGFGFSGGIKKIGSSQKKMGLKRKILLGANLNSTIAPFPKEANTNSTESVTDSSTKKRLLQVYKTPEPPSSKLQKFPAISATNSGMKSTLLVKTSDDIPLSLNSTVTINLNPAISVTSHDSNVVDRLPKTPDSSKNPATLCSTTFDSTFEVPKYCNSAISNLKSPVSLSRRSHELFMKLSPSKTSSPLQLQGEYQSIANSTGLSFEMPDENSLTSDMKVSPNSNGSRTLLAANVEDKSPKQICATTSQALLANQTIVIESCNAEEEHLNHTFQVKDQILHAGNAENSFVESALSCQTHFKCALNLPTIEEDEQSFEEQNISSIKTAAIVQLPIESAGSTLSSTKRNLNSTICIASEASVINATPIVNNVSSASVEEKTVLSIKDANVVQHSINNTDSLLSSTKTNLNSTICIASDASVINATPTVNNVSSASVEEKTILSIKDANVVQLPNKNVDSTLSSTKTNLNSTICISSEASVINATPTVNNVSSASVEEKTILSIKDANVVQHSINNTDFLLSSTKTNLNSTICIASEASVTNATPTVNNLSSASVEEKTVLSIEKTNIVQHSINNADSLLSSTKTNLNSTICIASEASVINATPTVSNVSSASVEEKTILSIKDANVVQLPNKNIDSTLSSTKRNLNSTICISSEASSTNVPSTVSSVCFDDNLEEQDSLSMKNANIIQRTIKNTVSTLSSTRGNLNSTICISSKDGGTKVTSTVNNVCSTSNVEEQDNLSMNNANILQRSIKNIDSTLSSTKRNLNSTICISSEASGTNATPTVNSAVNLNETFCYDTSATNISGNAPSLFQPENCKEPIVETGNCQPVASTPACRFTRAQFLPTLFTPILQDINIDSPIPLNQSSIHLDLSTPMLPSETPDPHPSQVSTNSSQSLGILSLSEMKNFTVDATANSLLEVDSPLTASFCNRMFPVDADCKTKGRFSSVSQTGASPDHLQRQRANTFSTQAFRNIDKIKLFSHSEAILSYREMAKENMVPITKVEAIINKEEKLHERKPIASPAHHDDKNANKRVLAEASPNATVETGRCLAKRSKLQSNESLLDLSTCADVALPDDSILDIF